MTARHLRLVPPQLDLEAIKAAFIGSEEIPRPLGVERSRLLYLNADRRRQWERASTIAYEGGRSDEQARDLIAEAGWLALEQFLAREQPS